MNMSMCCRVLAPLVVGMAFAASEPAAAFPSSVGRDACNQVEALKTSYLRCEALAQDGALSGAGIAQCSEVYETLKHRVFEGSYSALRAWYEGTEKLPSHSQRGSSC